MVKSTREKLLLITMGDPEGIGPEITKKALRYVNAEFPVIVLGNKRFYKDNSIRQIDDISEARNEKISFLEVETHGNDPSFEYVKRATLLLMNGVAGAMVTAPVSKEKWIASGNPFIGHTNFLVKTTGTEQWAMFFWSDRIKVALYTTHIPLKDIFKEIRKDKIVKFCRFIDNELIRMTGKKFDILMSGINPHAGENGNLGTEEKDEISPAIMELKKDINIQGPYPPDTVFIEAEKREDPVVISLYHDQGLIPFKLGNINSGVNLTLGLPFIRTSPDHGTAYGIAGKNIADPGSMIEAVKLANHLLKRQYIF